MVHDAQRKRRKGLGNLFEGCTLSVLEPEKHFVTNGNNSQGCSSLDLNTPVCNTPGINAPGLTASDFNTPGVNTPVYNTPGFNTSGFNTSACNTPIYSTPECNTPDSIDPTSQSPAYSTSPLGKRKFGLEDTSTGIEPRLIVRERLTRVKAECTMFYGFSECDSRRRRNGHGNIFAGVDPTFLRTLGWTENEIHERNKQDYFGSFQMA